jgi:hypothetical protein
MADRPGPGVAPLGFAIGVVVTIHEQGALP